MIVAEIRILKKIFVDCDTDIIIEIDMGGGGGERLSTLAHFRNSLK